MIGHGLAKEMELRRGSRRFLLCEPLNDLCRSGNEASRCLHPLDEEVGGECGGVFLPCSGLEDRFESHTRLLYKHVEKSFAVF